MLRTPHLNPLPLLKGRGEKNHGRCARGPRMLDDFEHLILKRMDSLKPRRQLGLFDATMIVMGGIVGAGIFANASEVAHRVHRPFLILGVWVLGGIFAMWGAFIWAELATRLPGTGGQYLYLREAYHPAVAFVYGWGLLLVTQTGGMAAVAVIFASYFRGLTGLAWNGSVTAAAVLLGLTGINCLGAGAGGDRLTRCAMDCRRYRDLNARFPKPKRANGSARVLRDGARRPFLRKRWQALATLASACGHHHSSGSGSNRHRLFRDVWSNFKL